jgi:hypothetical protein
MAQLKTLVPLGREKPNELDVAATPGVGLEILGCAMAYSCTKLWGELMPTAEPRVRVCMDCKSLVTLCTDQNSLDRLVTRGQCVAYLGQEGNSVRMTVGIPSRSGNLRAYLDEL